MEKNTTDVRHIPEIQAIAEYLRGMTFKRKVFGGADPEDVLDHFSIVTLQYEAVVSACLMQNGDYAQLISGLEDRLAQMEQENAQWDHYCRSLIRWHEGNAAQLRAHNEQAQRQIMALWAGPDRQRWSNYVPG